METSEYGMAAQEFRNNSQEILSHLEMYQPLIRKCIATYPIIVIIRAVTKLVRSLYFYQMACSLVTWKYLPIRTNDVTHSHSIPATNIFSIPIILRYKPA